MSYLLDSGPNDLTRLAGFVPEFDENSSEYRRFEVRLRKLIRAPAPQFGLFRRKVG